MLPVPLFEHLTRTSSARGARPGGERRSNLRVPLKGTARMIPIAHGRLKPAVLVRLKDLSRSGVAFLAPGKHPIKGDFLIGLPTPNGGVVWVWCKLRRHSTAGEQDRLICGSFLRILVPGQSPAPDASVTDFRWLEIDPDTASRASA